MPRGDDVRGRGEGGTELRSGAIVEGIDCLLKEENKRGHRNMETGRFHSFSARRNKE